MPAPALHTVERLKVRPANPECERVCLRELLPRLVTSTRYVMALPLLNFAIMARRVGALLGILILLSLLLALIWRVYRQHESMHRPSEAAVVSLDVGAPQSVEKIAPLLC